MESSNKTSTQITLQFKAIPTVASVTNTMSELLKNYPVTSYPLLVTVSHTGYRFLLSSIEELNLLVQCFEMAKLLDEKVKVAKTANTTNYEIG
jgi:hypothetical protein